MSDRKSGQRPGTHRDVLRPKTPPIGIADQLAVPEDVPFETTDQFEDPEELAEMRARRPVPDRLGRLEEKHDEFRTKVEERLDKVENTVANFGGQMLVIPRLLDGLESATKAMQQREHVTFTSKVELDTAKKLADVDVGKAAQLDAVAAGSDKRKLKLKAAGAAIGLFGSGGVLFELLHHFKVL